MASQLEETLQKLLLPDNITIQQATQQLKETFKDPNIVPGLCQVLGSSKSPQVRQYAAVLLRRKVQKGRHWRTLPDVVCQNIRENILQLLLQEPEKSVRNSIAQIVATVAKHDLPQDKWPQLFQFILAYTKNQVAAQREIGSFVLYSVAAAAGEQLKPHLVSLLQLLSEIINDNETLVVPYYAIRTMTELIFFIGDDEVRYIQGIIPRIMQVIKELIPRDEDQACEAMEVFDEMLECEVAIIVPHIKTVLEFCLEIAVKNDLGDGIRVKAMSFIASLVKMKKKAFLKHKMVEPVLGVLFPIICAGDEDDEDEDLEESESQKPSIYAPQVIDTMALHLPPDKLIPNVMKLVEPNISVDMASHRRACYLTLAVVAEGCADYVKNKHLQAVLHCVVTGLNDPDHTVRNAALFALGQFSEHLQPDISKFASELLPLLFQYLGRAAQEADKNPRGVTKSYYALEMFCESLEKDILPYLPTLMEHMLNILKTAPSVRPKELAISAIGATANAAKEGLKPYFSQIIEQFRVYLVPQTEHSSITEEQMRKLQIQTLDTLGVLARSVGEETFAPLAKECADFGLNLLNTIDDPDLRRCVYGLFAALSSIMKNELSPYLETLVTHMMGSLKSTEGVKTHFKEEEDQVAIFNEEDFCDEEDIAEEDDENDEVEDQKIEGISVENAFLDEKEDTCTALGELAGNTGSAFFPFLEQSFQEVLEMIEYPASGIKKASMAAVGQMCICVHKANTETQTAETQTALTNMLSAVILKYLQIMKEDPDREVVMTAIDAACEMLQKIGQPVLQVQGVTDALLTRMKEAFTHKLVAADYTRNNVDGGIEHLKLSCQDEDMGADDDEDDDEAEFDGMLIESAGDVLPVMAKLLGGQTFTPFFSSFLKDLMKRLKQTSSVAEKSFAVGTIAETVEACGESAVTFVDTLYPLFMKMIKDEDDEVRSNAIFGLGVLVATCGARMYSVNSRKDHFLQEHLKLSHIARTDTGLFTIQSQYTGILKSLFDILKQEANPRVTDNICAATCRMISTHKPGVPLEHVIPVIIQFLPLKEDFEESKTIFDCLLQLYGSGEQEIMKHIPKLISVVAQVVGTDQVKQETQSQLIHFVKDVQAKFPVEFEGVRSALPADQLTKVDACLTFTNGST